MDEAIIFIGIPALLIWLSVTYENKFLKLTCKMFAIFFITIASSIPLTLVDLSDKAGTYDLFAFVGLWFFMFFMGLWSVVLTYEMFKFFIDKKKTELEEVQ